MTTLTKRDAVNAAMTVAEDIAEGRVDPAALEAQAVSELQALVGEVVGPDDPVWELQVKIARGVLAIGGLPADEVAEWAAVARHRAGEPVNTPNPADTPPEPVSLPTAAHGPDMGVPRADADSALDVVAEEEPQPKAEVLDLSHRPATGGTYDPLRGWQPGNSRRS